MSGSFTPMRCCDRDCAGANHCTIGGIACDSCGKYFCADEINEDGLCPDCEDSILERTCACCGEQVDDASDLTEFEGEMLCEECLKESKEESGE